MISTVEGPPASVHYSLWENRPGRPVEMIEPHLDSAWIEGAIDPIDSAQV